MCLMGPKCIECYHDFKLASKPKVCFKPYCVGVQSEPEFVWCPCEGADLAGGIPSFLLNTYMNPGLSTLIDVLD